MIYLQVLCNFEGYLNYLGKPIMHSLTQNHFWSRIPLHVTYIIYPESSRRILPEVWVVCLLCFLGSRKIPNQKPRCPRKPIGCNNHRNGWVEISFRFGSHRFSIEFPKTEIFAGRKSRILRSYRNGPYNRFITPVFPIYFGPLIEVIYSIYNYYRGPPRTMLSRENNTRMLRKTMNIYPPGN